MTPTSPAADVPGCPDDVELLQLIEGRAAPGLIARVVEHAEGCAACRELLGDALAADRNDVTTGVVSAADVVAPPALPPDAPYAIGALIAEGGMGSIYRARDRALGREVALKVPRSRSRAIEVRFDREVAITARLDHPGIVPVHGAGQLLDGRRYYVMRFVDGEGLDEAIAAAADLPARLALLPHLQAVADAMAFAHRQGVIHRDLKPNNVLLGRHGESVIIDWGLAKVLRAPSSGPMAMVAFGPRVSGVIDPDANGAGDAVTPEVLAAAETRAGDVLGTPAYMAPEQARGDAVDERADVYALGAMLRALLTGRLAVIGVGAHDLDAAPPALAALCHAAMAQDPAARPADGAAFAAALRAALRPNEPAPRRRTVRTLVIATALVLAAAAGALVVRSRRVAPSEPRPAPARAAAALTLVRPTIAGGVHLVSSPSGQRVCVYSEAEMQVVDLRTGASWTRAGMIRPYSVQFVDETHVRIVRELPAVDGRPATSRRARWAFETGQVELVPDDDDAGRPPGWSPMLDLVDGVLERDYRVPPELAIVRAGARMRLDVDTTDLQLALAPGSAMLAIGEPAGRAAARVRVFDMHTGAVVAQSAPIETLSALGWRDPTTVVIAAGNPGSSEVSTMALTATGFAPPVPILRHEATGEWIGGVSFFDGKLVAVVTHAIATTHLLDLQDTTGESGNTVLDARTAAAAVGWRDATTLIVWNPTAGQVEDLALATGGAPASPSVPLVDEPFNATRAGELMIVTTRTRGGRQVSAFGPGRATPRWQRAVGELLLVRCAGDVAPPCVALVTDGDGVAMRQVDPTTGELAGAVLAHAGDVFDLAVSNDGTKLAWTDETWRLRQRGLGTNEPERVIGEQVVLARTVAFAPDDAVLVGFLEDFRRLARFKPGEAPRDLWKTRAPVVSLVRPSPDGRRIAFRERSYASVLMIEP